MPSVRIGPQTLHILPVTSVTHGEYFAPADLQAVFMDGRFETFWRDSSDGQYGPFTMSLVPTQFFDDSSAPLDYNAWPATSNTLTTFANSRIDALFGTSTEVKFYTWFALMQPRFGAGSAGGGGSTRYALRGFSGLSQILHEHGHGLGLMGEGRGERCNPSGCAAYDYADSYSVMGDGWGLPRQFSTTRKQAAGWVGGVGQSRVQAVTQSGDYQLDPFERGPKGRVIALRTSVGTQVDLEARIDGNTGGLDAGVIFRNGDTLMDLRRDTEDVQRMLPVGQTFALNGVGYTPLSFGVTGATVRITMPGSPTLPASNLRAP